MCPHQLHFHIKSTFSVWDTPDSLSLVAEEYNSRKIAFAEEVNIVLLYN